MTNKRGRGKVARMTLLAMLVAILIVLAYVNIPMPMGLSITFNMIPVAIAAIAMGLPGGMIVGGAFGLISFLQCFGIFGTSALGAALVNVSPVLMFIQRFVSRLLVGVLAALVYKAMCKTKAPIYVRGAVTGFSAAFFNTLFFMTLLVLFFGNTASMLRMRRAFRIPMRLRLPGMRARPPAGAVTRRICAPITARTAAPS